MVVFATAFTAISADALPITHDIQIELERRSGGFLSTIGFNDGPGGIEVPLYQGPFGTIDPDYISTGIHGDNPLYTALGRSGSPDDFATISSIDFQVDFILATTNEPGLAHRDMVINNIVLTSDLGSYSTVTPGPSGNFGSWGPVDYASGPSPWTFDYDVTLFLNGDPLNVDDSWVIRAGSTILATPIPAPAGVLALALAGALVTRRCR